MRLPFGPHHRLLPLALGLGLLAGDAAAQSLRSLVVRDDEVYGIGAVTAIDRIAVNDAGDWLVLVDTDAPGGEDFVLLRNGIPTLQEGDSLGSPEGATVSGMGLPSFNAAGDIGWQIDLGNVPSAGNAGAYFNSGLVVQKGTICTAPELTPGTPWLLFFNIRLNDNYQMLCHGTLDDPSVATAGDQALILAEIDADGRLISERVVVMEADVLPGMDDPIQLFGTATHNVALNNNGDVMTFVDTTASSQKDGHIYINHTEIAQESKNSPVTGRKWLSLSQPELDLNDYGEYVYSGTLDGDQVSDTIIIKNNEKWRQEGDIISAMAPNAILNFHSAPIYISNSGTVFWLCESDDHDASRDTAIFRNDVPVVWKGVTQAEGQYLGDIRVLTEAFHVPSDGRYLIVQATLDDGRPGAFLLDMGLVIPIKGCSGNTATLSHKSGLPLLGNQVVLAMDDAQGNGVLPIVLVSTEPVVGWPPCGIDTWAGELLIDLDSSRGNPIQFKLGTPWSGAPITQSLAIPEDQLLVDAIVYAQGIFWDAGDQIPEQNLLLTNGLMIQIALP